MLWISDFNTGDVYIFTLPQMTLTGTLTGFNQPQGLCSDKYGNVWITETGSQVIAKYSYSGTLVTTLTDSVGQPAGCSVNP